MAQTEGLHKVPTGAPHQRGDIPRGIEGVMASLETPGSDVWWTVFWAWESSDDKGLLSHGDGGGNDHDGAVGEMI